MKILHISIIVGIIITTVTIFLLINYLELETKPHTEMKIVGLDTVYNVDQIIQFQVFAEGYGYICTSTPEITIYKTDQPSMIAYAQKSEIFMCPAMPQMTSFSTYYPNQNDYYSTAMEQGGNYTLHVSYRNTAIEKMFMVKTK